jgi:NADH:ubiquinone oxidoreductase subunit 4 (subunit M)
LIFAMYVSNEGFTLHGLVFWCFKSKTPHMPIHTWICKTSQNKSNDEKKFLEMKWHWK